MTSDALSLHCPNCGAVAEPVSGRCAYCQARLATVSCPECFALMFEGTAFCPHCGAKATRIDKGSAAAACPGCRSAMEAVAVGQVSLLECSSCDGAWVDAADFERLCADSETQAAVVHRLTRGTPTVEATVHYRPCLRCGKMMNRVNFARASGTIIDVCRGHGTFLDRGELHAIVAFIRGGGLERARERELEQLHDERRRLERLKAAELGTSPTAGGDPHAWTGADLRHLIDWLKS
jgi:Zn-finger nucleic acid-binding protein/predicted RNA-binding Zn-ribbon protein involved in translation (DUF1610 family)